MTTGADGATSELLNALASDLRTMVQEELEQLRGQLNETAREASTGVLLLGGAGILGVLAVGTSAAMLLRVLERVLPRPWASVVATALYGSGAAALASAGLAELKRARQDMPRTTNPTGATGPTR